MMFTDRFLKVPIKIYNVKEKEMTGRAEYIDSYRMLNPFDISIYGPHIDEDNVDCVNIYTKGGDSMNVYMTIGAFEIALDKHMLSK